MENIDEAVCLVFGGDKGGTSTKLNFSILGSATTSSVNNAKIFAKYEVADMHDSIKKVLHPFFGTIKNMHQPEFCLGGHKVEVLLNGDFEKLGLLLGHEESGASYSSIKDEVERLHL